MTLLALDPGLATCGAAIFDDAGDLVDADAFTSELRSKPRGFRGAWSATDLGRRAGELATWLRDVLDRCDELSRRSPAPSHVVIEANTDARGANALYQMAMAAGVIRCAVSEAVPPEAVSYVIVKTWRDELGWRPVPRPSKPSLRGLAGAEKAAALKAHNREVARCKRDDDVALYALLEDLADGDRVRELVALHRSARSLAVHALDAFGIGRWWLKTRSAAGLSAAA